MIYLDNSATTKILPQVKEAMIPFLTDNYGNPNSKYYNQAEQAREAVNIARQSVADLIKAKKNEIVFTSGATESNNLVIKGYCLANKDKGKHIIVSCVEHSCILNSAKFMEEIGFEVTYLPVNKQGIINCNELEQQIRDDTILVSIMWANNELGTINDIKKISEICHKKHIKFHTDATQFIGKGEIDLESYDKIDFLSASAHKFYGPKGIGFLYIRRDENDLFPNITPLLHGGEQEFGLRSGTLAVHQIVGLGMAANIAKIDLNDNIKKLKTYEKQFIERMKLVFKDKIIFNNIEDNKIPGLISARIIGYNNQLFLKQASSIFAASTGSACSNMKPSYVLKACGYKENEIKETIRFSLSAYGDYNEFKEIE